MATRLELVEMFYARCYCGLMAFERTLVDRLDVVRSVDELVDDIAGLRAQLAALEAAETRALAELGSVVDAQIAALPASKRASALPLRDAAARLAVRVRLSDRAVQSQILQAQQTVAGVAATMSAWESGQISRAHVRVITESGGLLDDEAARARFETEVLQVARGETAARTRSIAERSAERLNPIPFAERHRRARENRRARAWKLTDGMSRLAVDVPTVLAQAALNRADSIARLDLQELDRDALHWALTAGAGASGAITASESAPIDSGAARAGSAIEIVMVARARLPLDAAGPVRADLVWGVQIVDGEVVPISSARPSRRSTGDGGRRRRTEPDERTLDQRRADVIMELLLAGAPGGADEGPIAAVVGQVQITVPVLTLLADDDTVGATPAEVAGLGPVDPATARALTANAPGWDRVLTHPITDTVVEVDRYEPVAAQRRYLRARDRHCRFPGCSMPARRCQIDHTVDHARGGRTHLGNLACLCLRHHILKHHSPWKVCHLPGGVLHWQAPDGRIYTDTPPPAVAFVPEALIEQARSRNGLYAIDSTPAPF